MLLSTALQQGAEILEKQSISSARLTVEVLLAHALRCDRAHLYAHPERELTQVEQVHFGRYLHERLAGRPTQYITGQQEFYGRTFRVTPAVLIPRPETELVVEAALKYAASAPTVLDVGTGSGCLAVSIQKERPGARVFACDISLAALAVARENAARLEAALSLYCDDLLHACRDGRMDLIISNPPYIPERLAQELPREVREHEPAAALFGGADGLDYYRRLLPAAAHALAPGGHLIVEISYESAGRVKSLAGAGWSGCKVERDLAGLERVLVLERSQ